MDVSPARVFLFDGFALSIHGVGTGMTMRGVPYGVQRLIAHLSLCRCRTRSAIAGQLWPDVAETHAQANLRTALWRVQKLVPGLVDVSAGAVALADDVRVDAQEFMEWAGAVLDPTVPVDHIVNPATSLTGDLLPGWYDDWVLLERERLRQLRMHVLEALADKLLDAGRFGEAAQAAYAAVRDEPLRESAHRAVVRVHLAEGNFVEALRAYHSFREALHRELGVHPTWQMDELLVCEPRRMVTGGPVGRPRRVALAATTGA
jgi:DNA-binding SARP family transcriptional activator